MTKKRNLTTFMIAIMIMLFSLPANALGTVGYAELNGNTLTFKGGENVPEGAFALNTGVNNPGWNGVQNCTTVVFDESFKDVRPTSAQVRKSVDSPPGMLTEDHHHTVHEERQVCYSSHLRPKSLHL